MSDSEKAVSFDTEVGTEGKGKGKDDVDEPCITVISAQNTPANISGLSTPTNSRPLTAKTHPELEADIQEIPSTSPTTLSSSSPSPRGADPTRASTCEASKSQRRTELASFCALLWAICMEGWNDGTSGPLIPTMQRHYNVGYAVVSLIFVMNCIGFVTGAVANIKMVQKLGFGTTVVIGATTQAIAYCIQAPAPPFPVFALAYILSGFGLSLQNAACLVFTIHLTNSANKMGVLQATYGVGALISPLVATKFSSMTHWSYHYFVSFAGAAVNVVVLCLVFRFQHLDAILRKSGQVVPESSTSQNQNENQSQNEKRTDVYTQVIKLKAVHVLAFFALACVGAEVTIGGWIVTFVLDERHGGASSGYLSSGFFGGLTLGRVLLLPVNKWVGERRVMYVYITLCIALEFTVWFIPSLTGNALSVSFIGFALGPFMPIATNVCGRSVPRWLITGAVGWMGGLGQMGSALLPFVTGALAERFGVGSLQPLVVASFGFMMVLWVCVPPDIRQPE